MLDCAGPEVGPRAISVCVYERDSVWFSCLPMFECVLLLSITVCVCLCIPAANSSIVMRGKRMRARALPRTRRLFSGVGCCCCLWVSASAQRTAAPNRRTSLTPRVSLSSTATSVSDRGRLGKTGGGRRERTEGRELVVGDEDVWDIELQHPECPIVPRSMSVKPSAARASPVFLSMFSRHKLAS